MPIEVTSLTERRWRFSHNGIRTTCLSSPQLTGKGIVLRLVIVLLAIAFILGGDALLRSYKYYSRIIDARLASGYLTSRPGLYAAPRSLRVGQGFSLDDLAQVLRRAGYVEKDGSDVWNGTFTRKTQQIDIRPTLNANDGTPKLVQISFASDNRITDIVGDDLPLESFTLEPEVLTYDLSAKTGRTNPLTYAEIPPVLVRAILAIEDHRFFEHSGVDLVSLMRAVVRNASDNRPGQGGSTITQQLVKNTYLSPERTIRRKYAEAMLALALERRLSKQDIFALYCNEVYLGQRGDLGARGVAQAAQLYFGKELKGLTLNEAATIAGMIQGPARYSPVRHDEVARERRNTVLAAMAREGWITSEENTRAAAEPVVLTTLETSKQSLAPYFIDYVNLTADTQSDVPAQPSRLYTTIDLDLQNLAELALSRQLNRLDSLYSRRGKQPQAALVALDPQTGNVLAMVGGRNYGESQLNRATDALRQPGSTFKPFVYAAALETGMSPVQMFSDAPREFIYDHDRIYRPANYGGGYSMREVTMREGLVRSLNVVTVDLAMQTGLSRIARLAENFGLPRPQRYPSLALGTTEVTPLKLAAAYAAFVNGGHKVEPKVVVSVAEPPATHHPTNQPEQIISPTTAYMITNMLVAVTDHGTARAVKNIVKNTAIAGKTGTSRDSWFVGYTPNLVCVVWIGFDDNSQLELTGAEAALPAWGEFISAAVRLRPELGGRTFECPEGIKFVEIDSTTGLLSTLTCPQRELIAVTDRTGPNLECYLHGNLPQPQEDESETRQSVETSEVAQKRVPEREKDRSVAIRSLSPLRVEVDKSGRRTLINHFDD